MPAFQPRTIIGAWRQGYALDVHTVSSEFLGHDEFGHHRFDNKRSEVGELLHKLKYRKDQNAVEEIVDAVARHMRVWKPKVDILVPVPASTPRKVQPVLLMAKAISQQLDIPLADCVKRTKNTPQLKNVTDLDERLKLLDGLHTVDTATTEGKSVLLFDDLYRSGATMNAITIELYEKGKASDVFALTITRTRSNQ